MAGTLCICSGDGLRLISYDGGTAILSRSAMALITPPMSSAAFWESVSVTDTYTHRNMTEELSQLTKYIIERLRYIYTEHLHLRWVQFLWPKYTKHIAKKTSRSILRKLSSTHSSSISLSTGHNKLTACAVQNISSWAPLEYNPDTIVTNSNPPNDHNSSLMKTVRSESTGFRCNNFYSVKFYSSTGQLIFSGKHNGQEYCLAFDISVPNVDA